jgi:hypothetical protein
VSKRPIKDMAASIRYRLQENAKATGRPFQEVLQYFAMERFLYRLAESPHAKKLVLKGALAESGYGTTAPACGLNAVLLTPTGVHPPTSSTSSADRVHIPPCSCPATAASLGPRAFRFRNTSERWANGPGLTGEFLAAMGLPCPVLSPQAASSEVSRQS